MNEKERIVIKEIEIFKNLLNALLSAQKTQKTLSQEGGDESKIFSKLRRNYTSSRKKSSPARIPFTKNKKFMNTLLEGIFGIDWQNHLESILPYGIISKNK